ncbi:peptidoglycan-binding protein LysM [Pseudomonas granadensis]|uniref:FimV/HubP family polar landmark protein n=1 Tax=Pseudomonas granadensis TaxID=1421430 RepID=UPI0019D31C32|nr:FimV/HubP family polar landmark protein [Pseudomonas granadensis]MBN6773394.1 peptidoglycan-binding protein LysM [Pseudomonas granadensis]MBN6804697.1 peptidoglycan-binding protein LysM [Pseudomonas granadensis]MBN6831843.1 peptidoglycan-binding protein LysM [Pseudomonas granadensis]MBN6838468.1 peptidoglycan-binding protein LysM [Pseudomonas granadensis]MBN6866805.1 peptidoglycan-binding protein LysM [Pseudomonas granadensis]
MLASRHVVPRSGGKWLLVAGVFSYSAWSMALGLGDITVHSALNQPLKADIALVDVGGLTQNDLAVSLATADEFAQAGVERVFFLNDLKFIPILRGQRQMIRVTSSKPVNEPFLNFLVQLNQPNGRLLREYTVLIDPPGSPGIVPATDEPDPRAQSSAFPTVEPVTGAPQAAQGKRETAPAATPAPIDDIKEQLAASELLNQQLQKTVDELNAKVQAQDVQIADGKKQVTDLQTRLAELQNKPPPTVMAPTPTPTPAVTPVEPAEDGLNWPLLGALVLLLGALAALFVRKHRQQRLRDGEPLPQMAALAEPPADAMDTAEPVATQVSADNREEPTTGDVLEAVGIYLAYGRLNEAAGLLRDALHKEPQRLDLGLQLLEVLGRQGDSAAYEQQENHVRERGMDEQPLRETRARHPKLAGTASLAPVLPIVVAAPVVVAQPPAEDDFELKLGELSMESSWDLEDTRQAPPAENPDLGAGLEVLPQDFELPEPTTGEDTELEWIPEPEAQPLDDDFLNEFADPKPSIVLEPLDLQAPEPGGSQKLEQAQTCIDDGDIDSAIALLNELLKEGDEPLKQTARTLLAGIR